MQSICLSRQAAAGVSRAWLRGVRGDVVLRRVRDGAFSVSVNSREGMYDPGVDAARFEGERGGAACLESLPETIFCLLCFLSAPYKMCIEGMDLATVFSLGGGSAGEGYSNSNDQKCQDQYGADSEEPVP